MATNLLTFRPSLVKIRSMSNPSPNSDNPHRKTPSSVGGWWSPLFGWSSEPDYIDGTESPETKRKKIDLSMSRSEKLPPRFAPGCFTEEKARRLRMLTKESAFHDVMYHSAIASRLASDFKDISSDLSD